MADVDYVQILIKLLATLPSRSKLTVPLCCWGLSTRMHLLLLLPMNGVGANSTYLSVPLGHGKVPRFPARREQITPTMVLVILALLDFHRECECSSIQAVTQTSGAFQLMVISLVDQASALSMKHVSGAHLVSPAALTYGS